MTAAEVLRHGLRTGTISALPASCMDLHLLIMEPDKALSDFMAEAGRQMGFAVDSATIEAIASRVETLQCDVVVLDFVHSKASLDLLGRIRRVFPRVPILITTTSASLHSVAEALRLGATDFLIKPFSLEEFTTTLRVAAEHRSFDMEMRRLRQKLRTSPNLQEMNTKSDAMQKLFGMVTRVALSQHPVMIVGESGTGKERIARMVHAAAQAAKSGEMDVESVTAAASFLHVTCGARSSEQLEAELFGSVRGEGTATEQEHTGLLTVDGGGTLFLDEVDALPLETQIKLLQSLQQRSVRVPGSASKRPITVRVLASSSRDLPALVERGAFRKDLYLRLNVVSLRVPPLRQRPEDIPLLAAAFLERHGRARNLSFSLGADASRALLEYSWAGNVRELEVVLERACAMSSGPVLNVVDLSTMLQQQTAPTQADSIRIDSRASVPATVSAQLAHDSGIESIAELERRAIFEALSKLNGDKLMVAKVLGIGKTTLYRKLKEYGVAEV